MFEGHDHVVFDLLTAHRLVDAATLTEELAGGAVPAGRSGAGESLAGRLIGRGWLEPEHLLRVVADHVGGDYLAEPPAELTPDILALIDEGLVRTYSVLPVAADRFSITVLAADPFNPHLVNDLSFALGRYVRLAVTDPAAVHRLIRRHYGTDEADPGEEADATVADLEQLAGEAPVIRLVNLVLAQAIHDHASDIHFEPFEREFKVRYRIDGVLHEMSPPARPLALPVISRLKVLANLNIAERRVPQDGRIKLQLGGRQVDLRVSTLPTQFGESVVLRVLDQSARPLELDQLGLPEPVRRGVDGVIHRPNGIFLVTGPTGSGKSTTLYSCLRALNLTDAKLLTVEDPVEYGIDGIMQVPVNPAAGLTFARSLRTFLRQDPDVVMVGEIRDLETARIAIQASLTGHLVLSTLHTNDAPSAITRLVDMGVEPFLLASTIEAVIAQRLLRRICPACRTAFVPGAAVLRELGLTEEKSAGRSFYSGAGCPACHDSGYAGRVAIFEFLPLNDELRESIGRGVSLVEFRQQALRLGMVSLRTAGLQAVFAGETTVEEVLKYT